jgi:hypothetical protein
MTTYSTAVSSVSVSLAAGNAPAEFALDLSQVLFVGAMYKNLRDINLDLEISITATPQGPSAISKESYHNPSSYQIGWINVMQGDFLVNDYRIRYRKQLISHPLRQIHWQNNPSESLQIFQTNLPNGRIEIDGHIVGNATSSGALVLTPPAGTYSGNSPFASQVNNMYLDLPLGLTHSEVPPPQSLPVLQGFDISQEGLPTSVKGILWPNWTALIEASMRGSSLFRLSN